MDDEHLAQVQRIVADDEDGLDHYQQSWCFPTQGGGYSRFAFFGCTVRDSGVSRVRSQLERIATRISSQDGDITDYVHGIFHVTPEDDSREIVWLLHDGRFQESVHEHAA